MNRHDRVIVAIAVVAVFAMVICSHFSRDRDPGVLGQIAAPSAVDDDFESYSLGDEASTLTGFDVYHGTNAPTTYQWYFGDGSANATVENPVHTYNVPGIYTVSLTMVDLDYDEAIVHQVAYITVAADLAPDASFTANWTTIVEGQSVAFTHLGSSGNLPATYQWDFGDGSVNATVENPVHQFLIQGNWTVTLTVIDANGNVSVHVRANFITVVGTSVPPCLPGTSNLSPGLVFTWIACFFVVGLIVGIGFVSVKRKARHRKRAAPAPRATVSPPMTAAMIAMDRERERRADRDRKATALPAAARIVHGRAVSGELERQAQRERDAKKRGRK